MAPLIIGFTVSVIGFSYGTNAGYALNPPAISVRACSPICSGGDG